MQSYCGLTTSTTNSFALKDKCQNAVELQLPVSAYKHCSSQLHLGKCFYSCGKYPFAIMCNLYYFKVSGVKILYRIAYILITILSVLHGLSSKNTRLSSCLLVWKNMQLLVIVTAGKRKCSTHLTNKSVYAQSTFIFS